MKLLRIKREPDFVIGQPEAPYLRRWWIIPRNRWFNIYLHQICRSDDDRALHDHPWWNVSIILKGGYFEWKSQFARADGKDLSKVRPWRGPGAVVFRSATAKHRLELREELRPNGKRLGGRHGFPDYEHFPIPCWSLFITGPRIRQWGFYCPQGWRHWREFIGVPEGEATGAERGPGCGEL